MKTKKRNGNDTFAQVTANKICSRLANGEPLTRICKDWDMPCRETVYDWINRYPKFKVQYEQARERQADFLVDEIIDIADGKDIVESDRDGHTEHLRWQRRPQLGDGEIEERKLRIASRQWLAKVMRPKKYGATQQVEINETKTVTETKVTRIEFVAPQLGAPTQIPALPDIDAEDWSHPDIVDSTNPASD